ncbi:MAG: hypothetical protein PF485_06465 [Bacteroidales bacterium]|jgi:hypothetical protein|nr:hypothetical protein [Bacteroidales bacterium]
MRNEKLNIIKSSISFLLLIIIGGIIFNSSFFLHSHRTACGKLIVHAHPFNKHAEKEFPKSHHEHNKVDLQLFSSLDYFYSSDVFNNIDLNFIFEEKIPSESVSFLNSRFQSSTSDRGPPFLI